VDLTAGPEGAPLKDEFTRAFEYSDCWVEDSRLVALNARDAEAHGANIMPRTRVTGAERHEDHWLVTTRDEETGERGTHRARMLVNAAGPWVGEILGRTLHQRTGAGVRLVRGSHIVTRRLFEHEKAYFFQGGDGRIIFAIPYETDFTLIGTTDVEHPDPDTPAICTPEEQRYLLDFASQYFERPLSDEDVVWTFSGVRPLYDDGARSATAATRDYTLKVDAEGGAPVLNVFGGKITTYRRLAESALALIAQHIEGVGADWTAGTPLPGGQFELREKDRLIMRLREEHPFLDNYWARRLIRAYGLDAWPLLAGATTTEELGADFGATLTQREVGWLMDHEFARTAEDVVWRRSKLGLRMSTDQVEALDRWMEERRRLKPEAATG
jgi:glycerol-3-phosphate dehydrogenase